jgi:hypothetical protein
MSVRLAGYFLPFSHHVNERMIRLSDGELMVTIELEGLAFEATNIADLNDWRGKLNAAWRNVTDPRIALHVHTVCLVVVRRGRARTTAAMHRRARGLGLGSERYLHRHPPAGDGENQPLDAAGRHEAEGFRAWLAWPRGWRAASWMPGTSCRSAIM